MPLTAALASGSFFAFLGGGPWVASEVLGMAPAELGFYFGFIAAGYMIGNFLSGRYSGRVGLNRMMLLGGIVSSGGLIAGVAMLALGLLHPVSFFGSILFVGLGNGLSLPSANAGMVSVRPHLAGSASGLGGALMIGGGAALACDHRRAARAGHRRVAAPGHDARLGAPERRRDALRDPRRPPARP
jgi:MFS transporter, DHA1 family, multidrug resistance protein